MPLFLTGLQIYEFFSWYENLWLLFSEIGLKMLSEVLCFHRITQFEVKKSSVKLLSDSERSNEEKMCFWVTLKGQMEKKYASEWLRKAKWRKNVLLSDSERPNEEKMRFWATQKDQMKKKCASEWLRKAKWRKNTLLSDSERIKRGNYARECVILI